jgi:hypothetical protein
MNIAASSIILNSDVLETNLLNLLVVIIALGILVQQYTTSVVRSYQFPLYETLSDYYELEKQLYELKTQKAATLAAIIRVYLNALTTSKYSSLELKALVFIRVESLRLRIRQFEQKTLKTAVQDLFKVWFSACFDEVVDELSKQLANDPKKQQKFMDAKIDQLLVEMGVDELPTNVTQVEK